jgi:hypothetical protein
MAHRASSLEQRPDLLLKELDPLVVFMTAKRWNEKVDGERQERDQPYRTFHSAPHPLGDQVA